MHVEDSKYNKTRCEDLLPCDLRHLGWNSSFEKEFLGLNRPSLVPARVVEEFKGWHRVRTAQGEYLAKIAGRVEDSDSECFSSNVRCTQMESNEYLRSSWRAMLLATLAVSAHDSALAKSAEIVSARIGASL